MACCDHCGCFDDNHIDGDPDFEDLTEEQLMKQGYEPTCITTGMGTYRKTIRCQLAMIVFVSVVSDRC